MADDQAWEYAVGIASTLSCVTDEWPTVRPLLNPATRSFILSLSRPATLAHANGGQSGLQLAFRELVTFAPRELRTGAFWQRESISYEYRLLDHFERELLVYHWHPESAGPDFPHIHVSASLDAQVDALTRRELPLDKRHVATGWVELRDVERMLITEFDVRPLRPDWEQRLSVTS